MGRAQKSDEALKLPYQDNISALVHDSTFKLVCAQLRLLRLQLAVLRGKPGLKEMSERIRAIIPPPSLAGRQFPDRS